MSCSHISYFFACLITSGGNCFNWVLSNFRSRRFENILDFLLLPFSQQACLFWCWCIWGELSILFTFASMLCAFPASQDWFQPIKCISRTEDVLSRKQTKMDTRMGSKVLVSRIQTHPAAGFSHFHTLLLSSGHFTSPKCRYLTSWEWGSTINHCSPGCDISTNLWRVAIKCCTDQSCNNQLIISVAFQAEISNICQIQLLKFDNVLPFIVI